MAALTQKKPLWRTVWFAVLLCSALLAVCLVPVVSKTIASVDLQGAVALNRGAGVSPVFDRLVLLIADEDGRERVVFLVLVWFAITLYIATGRLAKARMMGTLLFVATVLTCFFIVDSTLDDIFIRRSPSYFLDDKTTPGTFRSIGKILDFRVDLKEKRSFPNAEGMIFFTVAFLLLRLGRTRGGLLALALGLTVPLLKCVAGLNWLSDIYLGALPIAFFVSALAVETPFSRLHGTFIDLSAAGFDQAERFFRNLSPMWRHRHLYWASQNVFHMESAAKRFIAKDLQAILDPEKRHQDQRPHVEVPLGGLRSVIRIVTLGFNKVVVRAYPLNRKVEADKHFKASKLLAKNGIRVPKIIYHSESHKKHGALFLVEEFIDGESKRPEELSDADIEAAAREMARLHQVKSQVWGPITAPRTEEHGTVFLRRVDRQISQVAKGPVLNGQQAKVTEVREWFAQWRSELNQIREFSLIHGKLHRENGIFEQNGGFCLLDITTLEWGVPSHDLVQMHHSQFGARPDLIEKFDALYYSILPADDAKQGQRLQPLYDAYFCLGQVSKYTKRLGRSKRQVGGAVNKGVQWWNRLLEIVEQ